MDEEYKESYAHSLKLSIRDGLACALMLGTGESYVGAYGIFLRGTALQIGILACLPQFVGSFFQLLGVRLMEWKKKRRSILVWTAFLQALLWVPVALISFAPLAPGPTVWLFIGCMVSYYGLAGITGPVWNSLIGDLVPPGGRGRFFGRRSRIAELAAFIALVTAGKVLDFAQGRGSGSYGFMIIFMAAGASRFLSTYYLMRHADPEFRHQKMKIPSLGELWQKARASNFTRFAVFVALMNFSANLAGPYFALYMLQPLSFSYWDFTLVTASGILAQFFTLQHWGELSDRFGNKKILNVAAVGMAIVPILWLFSKSVFYLIFVQSFTGFVWAGFNLAVGNFLFDAIGPARRAHWSAYTAVGNGACTFIGGLLGGLLINHAASFFPFGDDPLVPFLIVFVISAFFRLLVSTLMLPAVHEVREVEEIPHRRLIYEIAHIRPLSGVNFRIFGGRAGAEPEKTLG